MSAEHARAPRVSDERLAWLIEKMPAEGTAIELADGLRWSALLDLRDARAQNERLRAERDRCYAAGELLRTLAPPRTGEFVTEAGVRVLRDALAAARRLRDATDAADTMIGDMLMAYEHGAERPGVDELYVRDVQRTVASALTATRWLAAPEPQEPPKGRNK